MSEWWTYSLSDFLLFSPRTYYRLFDLYNAALWPAHVLALAIGFAILVLIVRGGDRWNRAAGLLLAACWLWVAWAFLFNRYATINWAATWFAGLFVVQAALLALSAIAACGIDTYRRGWIALRHGNLNINALMSIAVTGALLLRQWPEAAMVMVLFSIAELIEAKYTI